MMIQIIGWIGLTIMLFSYFLLSKKFLEGSGKIYQSLNLIGAILLGINAFFMKSYPIFALEIFWCGIAIHTLLSKK